jgi:hypothetical protein
LPDLQEFLDKHDHAGMRIFPDKYDHTGMRIFSATHDHVGMRNFPTKHDHAGKRVFLAKHDHAGVRIFPAKHNHAGMRIFSVKHDHTGIRIFLAKYDHAEMPMKIYKMKSFTKQIIIEVIQQTIKKMNNAIEELSIQYPESESGKYFQGLEMRAIDLPHNVTPREVISKERKKVKKSR